MFTSLYVAMYCPLSLHRVTILSRGVPNCLIDRDSVSITWIESTLSKREPEPKVHIHTCGFRTNHTFNPRMPLFLSFFPFSRLTQKKLSLLLANICHKRLKQEACFKLRFTLQVFIPIKLFHLTSAMLDIPRQNRFCWLQVMVYPENRCCVIRNQQMSCCILGLDCEDWKKNTWLTWWHYLEGYNQDGSSDHLGSEIHR